MPTYKITFSDISIKEMFVESASEEDAHRDFKLLTDDMQDAIDNAIEVDGYYDNDIFIQEIIKS